MKVFISYGDGANQVTALRLQALGAVNGLTVFVPPAATRSGAKPLSSAVSQKLHEAEVVLGVVGDVISEACRQELNLGMSLRKNMIVMASPAIAPQLKPFFGPNILIVDPTRPDQAEIGIVQHLATADAQQKAKTAMLFLGTLALGLLIGERSLLDA
jgi:hypothetical protein